MPITLARQMYSPTVVFPIASDCAIERSLIPSACLNRSTSRTLRIDNLSAGIRHPLRLLQGPDHAIRSPTDSPPSRHLSGGRLQLESCPPSVGISGRFALECAERCRGEAGSETVANGIPRDRFCTSNRVVAPECVQEDRCHRPRRSPHMVDTLP